MKHTTSHAIEPTATACPQFVALAGEDFIDADNDLDSLIEQLVADKADQDVAVWDRFDSLAAVVLCDGTVQRFAPRSVPVPRLGAIN